eukprot:1130348-Prymnesium_polylepis.1
MASADDEVVRLAQEHGGEARPLQPMSVDKAIAALEGELPRPIIAVHRMKAVSGKAERKRREAFLTSCGLPR